MKNLRRSQLILALVAIIGLGLSSQVYGGWAFNNGGNPDELLQFNAGDDQIGTSIIGFTNNSTSWTLMSDDSLTGSGGQATVKPTVVVPPVPALDSVMVFPTDPLLIFTDIEVNLGILGGSTDFGTFTLKIIDQDDNEMTFFGDPDNVSGNGVNRFRLTGSDGMFIKKATLETTTPVIEEIKQIRLGGIAAIPEPSAFLFLGSLATLGAFGRWRKRHSS